MRHPLTFKENSSLRSRVLALIRDGCRIPAKSNILFVCGGNGEDHLRPKFRDHFRGNKEFLFFQPEYAIESILSQDHKPFNLSEFEELIGRLSLAIIIFPEAPGSCAEAGYFSAIPALREKTILVLDQSKLRQDSFLSIGPAKLIGDKTIYHPPVHFHYSSPDFDLILDRVRSKIGGQRRKDWPGGTFASMSEYDKLATICVLFDLMRFAKVEDIVFLLRGLFGGRAQERKVKHIVSILIGAELILPLKDSDNFRWVGPESAGIHVKDGFREERNAIRLEILTLLPEDEVDQEGHETDAG